jgi:N6-adenosine-specific RNA methylase IME4
MLTRYRTIVADPPWPYEGFASDPTSGRGLPAAKRKPIRVDALPYSDMSVAKIAALPVSELADDGCRLFCWTTNRYLPDTFDVIHSWGFRYVQTLVWHKTGNPSPFGGSVAPNHAEFLLVGVRGSVPVLSRSASNVITSAAQRKHSQKPEVFLDIVESVSPGPYCELFARRQRLGWDTWGNEALNHIELEGVPA